ncbi:MAG TPA: hypothetical protein VJ793_05445 [Anaerolineae bacterium]|nr:hypothetical protein [Anaerolineae bacterium]
MNSVSPGDILWPHLSELLAFRALIRSVMWPWRPRFVLEEKVLGPRVLEDGLLGSSCCFFVAVKT